MPDFFHIDLKQTSWRPASLQELADELGHAFERQVKSEEVEFFVVDSNAGKRPLASDEDVRDFSGPPVQDGEVKEGAEGEETPVPGTIKAAVPEAITAKIRQPRKLSALSTGRQIAKWAGEAHGIEFSLKAFDCGHFRLKEERMRSGSSSPSQGGGKCIIWEGRWEKLAEGIRLEFFLRYNSFARRTPADNIFYSSPPPESRSATLTGNQKDEEHLRGPLPSSLAPEPIGDVVLRPEADLTQASRGRGARPSSYDDDDDEEVREMLKPQLSKPPQRPKPRPQPRRDWDDDWSSDEPTWPMYLGIFLFIFIFCVFAYVWYEERYSTDAQKEFDEL